MAILQAAHKTDEPAVDPLIFNSNLHPSDIVAMGKYEQILKGLTLEMTGALIQERLKRIDAEFKRVEELKIQLSRLKRMTKAAILEGQSQ